MLQIPLKKYIFVIISNNFYKHFFQVDHEHLQKSVF